MASLWLKIYGSFSKAVYSTSFVITLKTKTKKERREERRNWVKEVNVASVDNEIDVNYVAAISPTTVYDMVKLEKDKK